jgi:hypothetical protein
MAIVTGKVNQPFDLLASFNSLGQSFPNRVVIPGISGGLLAPVEFRFW